MLQQPAIDADDLPRNVCRRVGCEKRLELIAHRRERRRRHSPVERALHRPAARHVGARPGEGLLDARPCRHGRPLDDHRRRYLATLTRAIRHGDGETLFNQFTRTRAIRRGIVDIGQDSPAPDFGRPHPDLPHAPVPRPYADEN